MLFREQPGCEVVGQVAGTGDLPADLAVYRPDVLVWDVGYGIAPDEIEEETGDSLTDRLADLVAADWPLLALLVDETRAVDIWQTGVQGLLLRDTPPERLVAALTAVSEGVLVLAPEFRSALTSPRESLSDLSTLPPADLTPREREVLQLLAEGLSNKAIARRLQISDHTVKFHVTAIMTKLHAQSRTEAVVRATRLGLILL